MTLAEFDATMEKAGQLRREAWGLQHKAEQLELATFHGAGLKEHHRDPGFPRWTIQGQTRYFGSPREALEAQETPCTSS